MDEKALWVQFACAAMQNIELGDDIDDDAEDVGKLADAMVEEYKERFGGRGTRRRGNKDD